MKIRKRSKIFFFGLDNPTNNKKFADELVPKAKIHSKFNGVPIYKFKNMFFVV